jgi:uncharacterized protein YndB with AHSA1/START domain
VPSATFRLLACAPPAAVWRALLCPDRSPRYLHGLALLTRWEPGAQVELVSPACTLTGQVLHVRARERLSLTVEDGSGCCTYLTWTLRSCAGGTVVRLDVAEADGGSTTEAELEEVWLPVLDRLGALLREETPAG